MMTNAAWKRILCGLLCAVMCWSVLPQMPVLAAEAEEVAAVVTESVEQIAEVTVPEETAPVMLNDGAAPLADETLTFETYDELMTLNSQKYAEKTTITYMGGKPLTLTRNLTLADNLYVAANATQIILADNVVISVNGTNGFSSDVTFGTGAYINNVRTAADFAELTTHLAGATGATSSNRYTITAASKISANEDFTIPAYVKVEFNGGLYLFPGADLTSYGDVILAEGTSLTSGDNCVVDIKGGTFTTKAYPVGSGKEDGTAACTTLKVGGTVELNTNLTVTNLEITGTLQNNGHIDVNSTNLTGAGNIQYGKDAGTVAFHCGVKASELAGLMETAANQHARWEYDVMVQTGSINADLEIPVRAHVTVVGDLTVSENVVMTINGELSIPAESGLYLEGNLVINQNDINGVAGTVTGWENVEYSKREPDENGTIQTTHVTWNFNVVDSARVKEAAELAAQDLEHWYAMITIVSSSLELTDSVTTSENTVLTALGDLTIAPGKTLTVYNDLIVESTGIMTVKGTLNLYAPAQINGELINTQYIKVYHDFDYNAENVEIPEDIWGFDCGILTTAAYSGNGYIYVYADMPEEEEEEAPGGENVQTPQDVIDEKEAEIAKLEAQLATAADADKAALETQIKTLKEEIPALKEAELDRLDAEQAAEAAKQQVFLQTILSGLNLNQAYISEHESNGTHYWTVCDLARMTQLAAPTNLEWGKDRDLEWSIPNQAWEWVEEDRAASISWKPVAPEQGRAQIKVYKYGEEEPVYIYNWSFESGSLPEWHSIESLCTADLESGDYYFTVTSIGDFKNYYNSDPVRSKIWTYTKPAASMEPCRDATWNWPQYRWNPPENLGDLGGYEIEIFYGATSYATPVSISHTWWYETTNKAEISDKLLQQFGDGYYYFRVRALSKDLNTVANGPWTALSGAYNLTAQSDAVAQKLNDLVKNSGSMGAADIRDSIQQIDTDQLKQAMLTDQSNSGVISTLTQLESAVGGAATVRVSKDVNKDFDSSLVSVVGANLNEKRFGEQEITLVVDKPSQQQVVPEAYENALLVRFSMNLDNVYDPENLDVPVKITLPVPYSLSLAPDRMVILHYIAQTGEIEEIQPYVYNVDGQWFATFVVTSFSDFTMAIPAYDCETDGHMAVIDEAVAPTCTETGLTEGQHCSECGEVITAQEVVPVADHSMKSVVTKPTCTEQGYTSNTCTVCGHSQTDDYVDALGHSYGRWSIFAESTCIAKGEERRECVECGTYESREMAELGEHTTDAETMLCVHCGEFAGILGDVNGDGTVTNVDAMLVLQYAVGMEINDKFIPEACDVDGDGKIDNIDAMLILQYAVEMRSVFLITE